MNGLSRRDGALSFRFMVLLLPILCPQIRSAQDSFGSVSLDSLERIHRGNAIILWPTITVVNHIINALEKHERIYASPF